MFKIDKLTWEKLNNDELKVVKLWIPQTYDLKTREKANVEHNAVSMDEIYQQIEAERVDVLKNAEIESEVIKKSARAEGMAEGIEIAEVKFNELNQRQIAQLNSVVQEHERFKEKMHEDLTEKSLKLAMVIAEKIINHKLQTDDSIFISIVKKAIENMDTDEKITLKVNQRDYEKYFEHEFNTIKEELQCDNLLIARDMEMEEGGLILVSNKEFVNAGIPTQLSLIDNALHKDDKQYNAKL